MRVFCPNCQEPVTISDDLAGQATFCPLCKAAFTAPALFSSSPATPAINPLGSGPLSLVPPDAEPRMAGPGPDVPPPSSSPSTTPIRYTRTYGFSFAPEIIQWLAPICLGIAIILTFFNWNGAYPGGHAVYTQSAWGALFAGFSTDPVGEEVLKLNPEKPVEGKDRLRDKVHSNFLLLLFFALLGGAFVLSVFFAVYPVLHLKLPPQLEPLLPHGMALVAGLALIALVFLAVQSLSGFGLENALEFEAKKDIKRPDNPTPEKLAQTEIEEGTRVGRLNIQHTVWLALEILFLFAAIVAAAFAFAMTRRTEGPHPRFEVMW